MQIEGTPNERALLVIFAYIAGFTAAFIAFVATQDRSAYVSNTTVNQASQSAAVQAADVRTNEAVSDRIISVTYENDGLYIHTSTEFPTLLSKSAEVAGVAFNSDDSLFAKQGFHSNVPYYEHISELDHVFFCEQYESTGYCTPYVYDIKGQTLHIFHEDGEPLSIDNRIAEQVRVTNVGEYIVGGFRSLSTASPWEMAIQ